MHSVLDTVTKWALNNKVKQVMVLDGIAAEGIPNLKRTPIIMSSDGEVADAASLIQDIEEPNDKEAQAGYDSERNIYPTTAYIGGLAGDCYPLVYQMGWLLRPYSYLRLEAYRIRKESHSIRIT